MKRGLQRSCRCWVSLEIKVFYDFFAFFCGNLALGAIKKQNDDESEKKTPEVVLKNRITKTFKIKIHQNPHFLIFFFIRVRMFYIKCWLFFLLAFSFFGWEYFWFDGGIQIRGS